jgi:hypothetical protein
LVPSRMGTREVALLEDIVLLREACKASAERLKVPEKIEA